MEAFTGFSRGALDFLKGLEKHNSKDWFEAHRADYENELLEPAKAFTVAMGERLAKHYPGVRTDPRINGTIRRLNRDVRFSADKTPYKNHLDLFFPVTTSKESCGPRLFLRIAPKDIWIGGGIHEFSKAELARFRDRVAEPKDAAAVDKLVAGLKKKGYETTEPAYKRLPRGYEAEGIAADYLRFDKLYGVWHGAPPKEFNSKAFVTFCAQRYAVLRPLMAWLETV